MSSKDPASITALGSAVARLARERAKPIILIAEDSIDSSEMLQVLLRTKGYEVVAANDGVCALELAAQTIPDLILLDLKLPRLDGLNVTRNLRRNPNLRNVPVIMISGYDPAKYREAAIAAGCADYLLKPIDFDRLDKLLDEFRRHV